MQITTHATALVYSNHLNIKLCRWRRDNILGRPLVRAVEALAVAFLTATVLFLVPFITGTQSMCSKVP